MSRYWASWVSRKWVARIPALNMKEKTMHDPNLLKWLRYYSQLILDNRDNESDVAVALAIHVQELDKELSSGGDFPADWKPF